MNSCVGQAVIVTIIVEQWHKSSENNKGFN